MNQEKKFFSLSTILNRVKTIVDDVIAGNAFWVRVEISQIKEDRRGHIYLDLVENKDGIVLAKCRATIWQKNAIDIKRRLAENAKEILKDGSEILCYCEIVFSAVYGLSINILEVDLSFSLGEVERIKQENLKKLKENGLLDLNARFHLPKVIQKIALISSERTAGHADFVNQLTKNEYGYVFHVTAIDCQVQGEFAYMSIIKALKTANNLECDAVVVIRGGGAALDLDVFNNYALAETIAKMNMPVLTGIGHETDSTVVDFVANRFFKTPSAVAAFIVEKAYHFDVNISRTYDGIMQLYRQQVTMNRHFVDVTDKEIKSKSLAITRLKRGELHLVSNRLISEVKKRMAKEESFLEISKQAIVFRPKTILTKQNQVLKEKGRIISFLGEQMIDTQKQTLTVLQEKLGYHVNGFLRREKIRINALEEIPQLYDLETILKKGFSIVRLNGKTINYNTEMKEGDELEIMVFNKIYIITLGSIKEVVLWNNLLMKAQL
ncbi:exodeoxyribonuclease VII large subunit [Myroides phaeus]|uniref:exodeoxyribonuclease VII large subunit n=1 Tax=Myroides phaeus TaxID=702745 RepID=UPI002DBF4E97|nr:exodeoxyribonuclease VII large subunit [Myroides phaeus]MEC4117345.1 exodeoxyribonuclease VII large subunit [Myroides phaeus]